MSQPRKIHAGVFVRVSLIDEPAAPVRRTMDHDNLDALVESIDKVGILEPIGVVERGHRWEVVFGHRRLLAARRLNLESIPAIVFSGDQAAIEALRVHENLDREAWNPAEEADYYVGLLNSVCQQDVDKLCALVRKKRAYVETRLLLALGDQAVFQSVATGDIPMNVAAELNLIEDPSSRARYLDAALRGGATARVVKGWRQHDAYLRSLQAGEPVAAPEPGLPPAQPAGSSLVCIICESNTDAYDLDWVYVHRACRRLFLDRLLATLRPQAPAPVSADDQGN